MGVVKLSVALDEADKEGLDLVLMSPNAKPMVCKIMDYGKYKFDTSKKVKRLLTLKKFSFL